MILCETEAVVAVRMSEIALRWRIKRDLAQSAMRRLEGLMGRIHDPLLRRRCYVVVWTLRRLPYAKSVLVTRAMENLDYISRYFGVEESPR
ncbi:MAG: hypothetical protein HY714_04295 [Candidatus Omnitrophica bacterium]|nr:hypothetical protein [Candidatus Omnitrophota bacterium]